MIYYSSDAGCISGMQAVTTYQGCSGSRGRATVRRAGTGAQSSSFPKENSVCAHLKCLGLDDVPAGAEVTADMLLLMIVPRA